MVVLWPAAALAHAKLVRSEPAAGATLDVPPRTFRLVFSEAPELSLSSIKLVTAAGDTVAIGNLRVDPGDKHALVGDAPFELERGDYRIIWRVAAHDGHPTHGTIDFKVLSAAVAPQPLQTAPAAPVSPAEHDMGTMASVGALEAIGARWLSFVSIFLVIGVVTFRFAVLGGMNSERGDLFMEIASVNAATLGIVGSAGAVLGAALKLVREAGDMPDVSLRSMMLGSMWGWSILIQIVAPVVAAVGFRAVQRGGETPHRNAWALALAAAVALAIAPSLGAHALAGDNAWLAVPADVVHVAVGSMWVGTLAVIVVVGISAALKTPDAVSSGARVARMINVFSPVALSCGAAIVATGLASTVLRLPSVRSLWTTPYGIVLIFKLVFVATLFGAGAWNWKRIKPRLSEDASIIPLKSSASLELLVALVVLGITAILVALEAP